jgi:hypothetical protein
MALLTLTVSALEPTSKAILAAVVAAASPETAEIPDSEEVAVAGEERAATAEQDLKALEAEAEARLKMDLSLSRIPM